MLLYGPAGCGKTMSALLIALGLGVRVCVIDSERGSSAKYSDRFVFDVCSMRPPHDPDHYTAAVHAAGAPVDDGQGGRRPRYDVIVVDSASHLWDGAGGCNELVDVLKPRFKGNKWAAWSAVTPRWRAFVDAILGSPAHVIVTCRAKTSWETIDGKPQRVGLEPIQRPGFEYEFDVVAAMANASAMVEKSRFSALQNEVVQRPGVDLGRRIAQWLSKGENEDHDERAFAARVADALGLDEVRGGDIDGFCLSSSKPVPQLMPAARRDKVVEYLASDAGRARWARYIEASEIGEASAEPPASGTPPADEPPGEVENDTSEQPA